MNKSDFLNTLRDSTIQEYLNSDKNRSSFIAHQIREAVNRFEPPMDPEKYEASKRVRTQKRQREC
jgi:hypothetical protein